MRTIHLASVLAASHAAAVGLDELFQGDRLIDTLFVLVLIVAGLVAAGVAWKRSMID